VVDTFGPRGARPAVVAVVEGTGAAQGSAGAARHLARIVATLERDGFATAWDVDASDGITFRIGAGTADCAECLVPRPVITAMLGDALKGTPYHVTEVVMPTEPP